MYRDGTLASDGRVPQISRSSTDRPAWSVHVFAVRRADDDPGGELAVQTGHGSWLARAFIKRLNAMISVSAC